ncbi:Rho GTPase-activating protein 21 [Entomortierella beljakovae]|nr:Rho GTPase-activating protein 21 [Entomortierella beljakovae]
MSMQWAIAEWDYFGVHEDELVRGNVIVLTGSDRTFSKSDRILIQNSSHEEWWEGTCNGLSGIFPANRCRLLALVEDEQGAKTEHVEEHQHKQEEHADNLNQNLDHNQGHLNSNDGEIASMTNTEHAPHGQYSTESSSYFDHADTTQDELSPTEPIKKVLSPSELPIPPNWSAATNTDGETYYYNVLTKETSWKLPSDLTSHPVLEDIDDNDHNIHQSDVNNNNLSGIDDENYEHEDEILPEGWSSAQDEDGSQYFFNSSTGQTTWDRPVSYQQTVSDQSSDKTFAPMYPPTHGTAPKRQSSMDDNMLQSQLLSLSLSEEEIRALELNQIPIENIGRRGALRVKSKKVSTNATISSWKDYWVVVYKGFLLFYRDENGLIKNAHSLKSSVESMSKLRNATQVKPSGCFDAEKVSVELPTNGQNLSKKKNFFFITPGTNVRLLLQDASGGDEKAWVNAIKSSLESRKADESTGSDDSFLIQVLKHQTSETSEKSGLRMNKKIEAKDYKAAQKGPLKLDKSRGIRNIMAHGIHGPRRKSGQDERLRLPTEDDVDASQNDGNRPVSGTTTSPAAPSRPYTIPNRKSSRDQTKESSSPSLSRKDTDGERSTSNISQDLGSPGNSTSNQSAKAKLSNMSRNFFSKDKDGKEKEKDKEKYKDKSKDKLYEKQKQKHKAAQDGSNVFGGYLVAEPGRSIPNVVELCVTTIEARGLSMAGIYRVSGHMASIQNLKKAFDEGLDVEKLIKKEPDVNTIAALLKLYFRELREPLIPFEFYPSFIAAADISEYDEKLYTIKSLVHSLPEINFDTLKYLMTHLGHVQDQYQTTKMDSANLAICFAPNLLRQEVDDLTSIINTGKQSSIVNTLIEQQEWIFDPYPEDDDGNPLVIEEGTPVHEEQVDTKQYEATNEAQESSDIQEIFDANDTTSRPQTQSDNIHPYHLSEEEHHVERKDSLNHS